MKTVILYDSVYGNTEMIAKAIGESLIGDVKLIHVDKADASDVHGINLLVVGSPTHGGRPTVAIDGFLKALSDDSLAWMHIASFDTRFAPEDHGIGLKIVMRVIRFAAERIAKTLVKKGGVLVTRPMGFIVEEKAGPLKKGEIARAKEWAKRLQ